MQPPATHKRLIFLGDYVDRGPACKEVIDILLHDLPQDFDTTFLKGNHEDLLLNALEDDLAGRAWLMNGGFETIRSYGIEDDNSEQEQLHKFKKILSREHLEFFRGLKLSYTCGDFFFTHAGINPEKSFDEQEERDLIWIRDRFLDSRKDFGKIVVHGHTPVFSPDIRKNRIGIDTGAVYGRSLTTVMLDGTRREFLAIDAT
jgi:serine/threonine protein phosphatase 1